MFYKRGEYLWIGKGDDTAIWFGDTTRAMNKFDLTEIVDSKSNVLKIPSDLEIFIFDYGHSKFIECNRELARKVSQKYVNYTQNQILNEKIRPCMSYIASKLEFLKKRYWLAGGTLLGWLVCFLSFCFIINNKILKVGIVTAELFHTHKTRTLELCQMILINDYVMNFLVKN